MALEGEEASPAAAMETVHMECPGCPRAVKLPGYDEEFPVGDLVSARVGPRSWLWATPVQLETLVQDLKDWPERYLQAAEQVYGPCPWPSVNLLVMSQSFPEDFAVVSETVCISPCLLTEGRPLVHLLTHWVVYPWFGHFQSSEIHDSCSSWISAGLMVFARRQVLSKMLGEDTASLEAYLGQRRWQRRSSQSASTDNSAMGCKRSDLEGIVKSAAGERGFAFFAHLKHCASTGSDDMAFDRWLAQFFGKAGSNAFAADELFASLLLAFPHCQESLSSDVKESWLHGAEAPWLPDCSKQSSSLTAPVDKIVRAWEMIVPTEVIGANEEKITKLILRSTPHVKLRWNFYQLLYFLESLEATQAVYRSSIMKIGDAYGFNVSTNAEVAVRWCRLLIRYNCQDLEKVVVRKFLLAQGAAKYTLPIYRSLAERAGGEDMAWKWIAKGHWEEATAHLDFAVKSEVEDLLGPTQCLGVF